MIVKLLTVATINLISLIFISKKSGTNVAITKNMPDTPPIETESQNKPTVITENGNVETNDNPDLGIGSGDGAV